MKQPGTQRGGETGGRGGTGTEEEDTDSVSVSVRVSSESASLSLESGKPAHKHVSEAVDSHVIKSFLLIRK